MSLSVVSTSPSLADRRRWRKALIVAAAVVLTFAITLADGFA